MKVRALRGVCVGVARNLQAGDTDDLQDAALVQFLVSIGAVEVVTEPPAASPPSDELKADEQPVVEKLTRARR